MNESTPPPDLQQENEETFDLHRYWHVLVQRRWLTLPFFAVVIAAVLVGTYRQTKFFDATCTIIIDLAAPKVFDKDMQEVVDSGSGGYWYSREYYETQYKVIASRSVAQRVADRLQLQTNARFLAGTEPKQGSGAVAPGKDPVAVLQRNLRVEPVKESRIVRIRYEDPDPELAALIANAYADSYIEENLSVRSNATLAASEWLEKQLVDLDDKLEQSGLALFAFKKDKDIVATSWEDRQTMLTQRLAAVNDALSRASVRKAELQARNDAVAALGPIEKADEAAANAVIPPEAAVTVRELQLRYLITSEECADLNMKYLSDHPKVAACGEKLALAKQAKTKALASALDSLKQEYQEAAKTEANLRQLLAETKGDAFAVNQYEPQYLELKRAHDNNLRLYDLVLKRLKDTGVTGLLQVSNVRILERARPGSRPVRPVLSRNLILAILLGGLGSIALAFAANALDRSVTSQEQIEESLKLAFLGIVPDTKAKDGGEAHELIVKTQPKSAAAECMRAIRTNLLFMSPERPLRSILITSSGPQEGKTSTAALLALTMTASGQRVLLVDADMRRPRVHKVFQLPNAGGLSSLILGDGTLQGTVRPTDVPNLWVLPCGPVPPNPSELLHTESFKRLLTEMEAAFDLVIIDSPPVGVVADAAVIAAAVDGTVLVIKAGKTAREAAKLSVRQLRDVNANMLGGVLNALDLTARGYAYGYSYYYRYGYYEHETKGAGAQAGTSSPRDTARPTG